MNTARRAPGHPGPARPSAPRAPQLRETDRLLMAIDPETREALRLGDTPKEQGPAFFTSVVALEAFCEEADLQQLEPYEVPAAIVRRMAGKPFWLDGQPGTVEEAARRLAERQT
jgi:hypothetical protein